MKQVIQNDATDAFRRKHEMLSQDRKAAGAQKSNFDPTHKQTILITKTQKPFQKIIFTNYRKGSSPRTS
jgi:hypothetical protein